MKNCVFIHISRNQITNKKVIAQAFKVLQDGKYKVTIENYENRSNQQNKYLHGVVIPMVFEGLRDIGYNEVRDHQDAKDIIKKLFLKRSIYNPLNDDTIEIIKRTRDLTTEEMITFIDEVVVWASQYLSITIPGPNTQSVIFAEYDNDLNATIIK